MKNFRHFLVVSVLLSKISLMFILLSQISCHKASPKSAMWGELTPGAYGVGFRIRTFFDDNRNKADVSEKGRRIDVMIWYPSESKTDIPKLTFRDYLLLVPEFSFDSSQVHIRKWLSTAVSGDTTGVSSDTLDRMIETEMQAVPDTPIIDEKFPLVLWTMRHGTMVAQSVLCEFLASHGYVVAYARYGGLQLPFPWQIQTATEKLDVFSKHLKDLNFALQCLSREPDVMPATAAIVTWSYAAELAPLVQSKNSSVQLVIGLSSNLLSISGPYQGDSAGANLKPDSLDVPYVIMTEQLGFDGKQRSAPAIVDELPTDVYYLSFRDLAHGNFNMLEGMLPALFGVSNVQSWSTSGQTAKLGYETISRYTLQFLDLYLKQGSRSYPREFEKRLPQGFVQVTQHGKTRNKK